MQIQNLTDAERVLQSYVPNVAKLTGDNMSLKRIAQLMDVAGNPHEKLQIVHVAGTSGKTSTCYYIAAILQQSGKKTALTVSPHINTITERIQINGINLSDDSFCRYLEEFMEFVRAAQTELSYFEVLIGLAFWVSYQERVDYLVLETGMGGLHDASNVASRSDKVCVITDIGYDHMHILGNTLPEITAQKAGIIYPRNTAFMFRQSDEVNDVVIRTAAEKNAQLTLLDYDSLQQSSQLNFAHTAQFQKRNWLLAEQVCAYIAVRDGFTLQLLEPDQVTVPGRMELLHVGTGPIMLDGAHNQQKMHSFVTSYQALYPGSHATIMLAVKSGKEYTDVIDELKPIAKKFIFTKFHTSQDLPAVSEEPAHLHDYAVSVDIPSVIIDDLAAAYNALLSDESEQKIITGSFYLLSQIKEL